MPEEFAISQGQKAHIEMKNGLAIISAKDRWISHLVSYIPSRVLDFLGIDYRPKFNEKVLLELSKTIQTLASKIYNNSPETVSQTQSNFNDLIARMKTLDDIYSQIRSGRYQLVHSEDKSIPMYISDKVKNNLEDRLMSVENNFQLMENKNTPVIPKKLLTTLETLSKTGMRVKDEPVFKKQN